MVSDDEIYRLVNESTTLSEGSKSAYTKQLRSVQKALNADLSDILLDPSLVERLDVPLATKVAYANALHSLFKRNKESLAHNYEDTLDFPGVTPGLSTQWGELLRKLHVKREEIVQQNTRSEREKANWVTEDEWKAMDKHLTETEQGSQTQLLVAFHTRITPPRGGDLAQVHICSHSSACIGGNLLFLDKHPRLVIKEHKTRRKYGAITIDLPESLVADVKVSLEKQPREFLFTNSKNEEYITRDAYMTWKSNAFRRIFGRDVTTNMARREKATNDDMNEPVAVLEQKAHEMGHSIKKHHEYRVAEPRAKRSRQEEEDDIETDRIEGGGIFSSIGKFFGYEGSETKLQNTIDPKDLQRMCEQAYALYNGRNPTNVGKWDLIKVTREDLLYRNGNVFIVAVRGTQGAPLGEDWSANRTIPINGLANTDRCKRDLATVRQWKTEFGAGTWYATGHSLGGAICDELLRAGLVEEAFTFNPAVQTRDFNGKLKNRRVYARGDPLYQLFGRFTVGSILQPATSLAKELSTRLNPLDFAVNALDQHNLSAFDAHALSGGIEGITQQEIKQQLNNA
jgi:hypothetical protein